MIEDFIQSSFLVLIVFLHKLNLNLMFLVDF